MNKPDAQSFAEPIADSAMELLSTNVVVLRAQRRLSQAELAKHAGIARQTISKIEGGIGNVRVDILAKLAAALACSLADLFEPMPPSADDAEIRRRMHAPASEFVDADILMSALDEADRSRPRYSHAGRPRSMKGRISPRRPNKD